VGFLHLVLEVGFTGDNHNLLRLRSKVINGGFLIQSGFDSSDGDAMEVCLLYVVQPGVEIDELLVHLVEVLAEVVGEVLEQLLYGDGGGSHGSSGLRILGVRVLLEEGVVARAGGSGYGGGKVATRVWGERRGRWHRDIEEREALKREG
jgi:hypothetical protein